MATIDPTSYACQGPACSGAAADNATVFCPECNKHLCASCNGQTHSTTETSAHTWHPIASSPTKKKAVVDDSIIAAMCSTARIGDVVRMKEMIDQGIDVNVATPDGATPLHWASYYGHEAMVLLLLKAGARTSPRSIKPPPTPLHLASGNGHYAVVKHLLEAGASPTVVDDHGVSPLHRACIAGHAKVAEILWRHGADPNYADDTMYTPLLYAVHNKHANVVEVLLRVGVDPNGANREGSTCMHLACRVGDSSMVTTLLAAGASPTVGDSYWVTPLHKACKYGHGQVVQLLLKCDIDPNIANCEGFTPLHDACINGHLDIVKALLSVHADANFPSLQGSTPLHLASVHGHVPIVKYFLANGANRNIKDYHHKTAEDRATPQVKEVFHIPKDHPEFVALAKEWKRTRSERTELRSAVEALAAMKNERVAAGTPFAHLDVANIAWFLSQLVLHN